MLRWATIHKKLVARLCATLVASGSLAMAGEIKKNRHPIRRVAVEDAAIEVAEATAESEPAEFAEAVEDAVPAELAQAERAAEREKTAGEKETEDDGADVFDAALHPDPWCAPGAFTGPQQPSQYDSQMQNAIQNPQSAMNQPRNNFDFSGGQNYAFAGSSRNVPAFMGDFFGGGGGQTVTLPGLGVPLSNTFILQNQQWSVDADGRLSLDAKVNVAGSSTHIVSNTVLVNYSTNLWIDPTNDNLGAAFGYSFVQPIDPGFSDDLKTFLGITEAGAVSLTNGVAVKTGGNSAGLFAPDDEFVETATATFVPTKTARIPLSATAGRVKLSENSSPIPRDRLLVNYSYFSNVSLADGGVNVNRITPGFEKTLFSKYLSVEVRAPMAVTLDQDIKMVSKPGNQYGVGSQGFDQVEMGDVTATLKAMFLETETMAMSTGLGMSFPTSDDISVRLSNGVESLRIDHRAMHIMPFVGGVYAPNDRFFGQWIAQVDVAANGDPVLMNRDPNRVFSNVANGPVRTGVMNDPTFLYLDANAGYWTYRSNDPNESGLSGFALVSELHYNRSLQNFDQVSADIPGVDPNVARFTVGDNRAYLEQLNFMIGCVAEIGGNSVISTGYAVPLTGNPIFDGEFRMTYNYYFGRSSRRVNQFGNRPPGLL